MPDSQKAIEQNDTLLCLPPKAGRAIIEAGNVHACPLLGTDKFASFCTERGVPINRERLLRLERLGLFEPVFRVKTPRKGAPYFNIPIQEGNNWFTKRWAWDCTALERLYKVPSATDRNQEGYYSVFQIDYLGVVINGMTIKLQLDSYLGSEDATNIDWQEKGARWMKWASEMQKSSCTHEFRRSRALLCQFVSNRYFPKTQTDQRTFRLSEISYTDEWISVILSTFH